ncbi:MAG: hypothetical protein ACTHKA_21365 [Anaerocolumna jejuensis]
MAVPQTSLWYAMGAKCERRALSHSIIYGSTTDKSAVYNGSKCGTEVNNFIIILKRLKQ